MTLLVAAAAIAAATWAIQRYEVRRLLRDEERP